MLFCVKYVVMLYPNSAYSNENDKNDMTFQDLRAQLRAGGLRRRRRSWTGELTRSRLEIARSHPSSVPTPSIEAEAQMTIHSLLTLDTLPAAAAIGRLTHSEFANEGIQIYF